MAKFRKKPVVIDAVQWDGTEACLRKTVLPFFGDLDKLPNDGVNVNNGIGFTPPDGTLYIPTLEGNMAASPGDWIIKGIKGEFYPCKPDIFEATYEPVYPVYSEGIPPAGQPVQQLCRDCGCYQSDDRLFVTFDLCEPCACRIKDREAEQMASRKERVE